MTVPDEKPFSPRIFVEVTWISEDGQPMTIRQEITLMEWRSSRTSMADLAVRECLERAAFYGR